MPRNPNCTSCSLYKTCQTVCLYGDGTRFDNPIIFIGEAPGKIEDAKGLPFVGRAGQYLIRLIRENLGLARNQVYITNTTKCRPPENRKPTLHETKACRKYLLEEIETLRPRLIVTLGLTAHISLFRELYRPEERIQMDIVRKYEKMYFGEKRTRVIATYHPAAVLYSPQLHAEVVRDFQKIKELAKCTNPTSSF